MNDPNHDMLISLNTKMEAVLVIVKDLPKEIADIRVAQSRIDERVDTHNKFLWGSILSSISAVVGLFVLAVKGLIATGKGP